MKIINVQENKIFAGEEDFLKFVSVTGVTPHSSIAGVYNGIAKIAKEKGSKIFTTSKSSEKQKIQNAIDNRLKEEREEILYESWEDFKEEFSEEKQETLKEWDQKFKEGDFYFVELTGLACDTYSKYGKIQNTNSMVIFKVEDKENTNRIDLEHKEIFCIDRQFGNPTEKRKNGKIKTRIWGSLLTKVNATKLLFYFLNNEELFENYKEEVIKNVEEEINTILNQTFDLIEKEKEEERIKEENRRKQKELQKAAQKKAKEEAENKEKREKAIKIYKGFFDKQPTEEEIKKIMEKM